MQLQHLLQLQLDVSGFRFSWKKFVRITDQVRDCDTSTVTRGLVEPTGFSAIFGFSLWFRH
jgi:hypothetical protein